MISTTLALCALLAPQELQDEFQFGGPWTFRETTPETGEPRFGPSLEVLDPTGGGVLARSSEGAWLGSPLVGPDLDGDGRREVAIGNAWAERPGVGGERPWVGAAAVLNAVDGRTLWRAFGQLDGEGFGYDLAPAGDLDGDGTDDVAVLVRTITGKVKPARVAALSGRDGSELASDPIEQEARFWKLVPVGDLDGDGALELYLPGSKSDAFVLGSHRRAPLDVSGGWKLAWAASIGDLDADGHDDLVLGRIERVTGEKRVSIYSRAGLRDVPEVALLFLSQYAAPGGAGAARPD